MVFLALFLKPIAWYVAFKSGTIESMKTMLLWTAGITFGLTIVPQCGLLDFEVPMYFLIASRPRGPLNCFWYFSGKENKPA